MPPCKFKQSQLANHDTTSQMGPKRNSPTSSTTSGSCYSGSSLASQQSKSSKLTDFSIAAIIGDFELNLKDNCSNHSPETVTVLDLRKISITSCQSSSPSAYSPTSSITSSLSSSTTSSSTQQLAATASQTVVASSKKFRPKNFTCPLCKMAYSNNGQLKNHVRIHTGERPFQCSFPDCNKSFTRNEELTRHKLIHTGVRPHSCNYCGKKFGRKDHLKKHVRTHDRKQEFQRKVFQVVCNSPKVKQEALLEEQQEVAEEDQIGINSQSPKTQQQQVQACGGCFCC